MLDRLEGNEAGLAASYARQAGDWRLEAQAWASRFVGGEVGLGGQEFAIGSSKPSYGGRIQIGYSF